MLRHRCPPPQWWTPSSSLKLQPTRRPWDDAYRRVESAERYINTLFLATNESFNELANRARQYSGSAGLKIDLSGDWSLDLAGGHGVADNRFVVDERRDFGSSGVQTIRNYRDPVSLVSSLSAVADGSLVSIGGVTPRASLGFEIREEEFEQDRSSNTFNGVTTLSPPSDLDRDVRAAFSELRIPIVENGGRGFERLELSLGARYDDYSDLGSTFNKTAGLIWQPTEDLTLRGSYATAFRAPALIDLRGSGFFRLRNVPDPLLGGTNEPVLFLVGANPDTGPEEAISWSAGFDYAPHFAPWARLSLSWFSVDYDQRIELPMPAAEEGLVLQREDRFPGLIDRAPTLQDVTNFVANRTFEGFAGSLPIVDLIPTGRTFFTAQDLLTAFPGLILVDVRTTNLAVETYRGLDLKLDTNFDTGIGGLNFGVKATYTQEHNYKITLTSPVNSRLNRVGLPVDFRLRANAGWTDGPWGAFLYLNYVDSYANPSSMPVSKVSSWTTADLTMRLNGTKLAKGGWLTGIDTSLSVSNLFDDDPPFIVTVPAGGAVFYDPANASAVGRYVTLNVIKRW